jgi:hypothetical protein
MMYGVCFVLRDGVYVHSGQVYRCGCMLAMRARQSTLLQLCLACLGCAELPKRGACGFISLCSVDQMRQMCWLLTASCSAADQVAGSSITDDALASSSNSLPCCAT